jgi:iron complex transport system substrate-binding protein
MIKKYIIPAAAVLIVFFVVLYLSNIKSVRKSDKHLKIVSLMPSYTETIFALGIDESNVAAVTAYCNYPPGKIKNITKISDAFNVNIEALIDLHPTIVFANEYQKKMIAQIRQYNEKKYPENKIKLVVLKNSRKIEDVYILIKTIALRLNRMHIAEKIISQIQKEIAKITVLLKDKPRVYVYIDTNEGTVYTAGGDVFISDIVSHAGGINIFEYLKGYPKISWEKVYAAKKLDFILATYGRSIDRKIPENVGIISDINPDIISRDGPRIHMAVKTLFGKFYSAGNR